MPLYETGVVFVSCSRSLKQFREPGFVDAGSSIGEGCTERPRKGGKWKCAPGTYATMWPTILSNWKNIPTLEALWACHTWSRLLLEVHYRRKQMPPNKTSTKLRVIHPRKIQTYNQVWQGMPSPCKHSVREEFGRGELRGADGHIKN